MAGIAAAAAVRGPAACWLKLPCCYHHVHVERMLMGLTAETCCISLSAVCRQTNK